MELAKLENMLIYMPHPRSKGSTGFPDAMKDTPQFNHDNYRGIGMRWGMGLDGSEIRLCEIRCQTLLDDMNNWVADRPGRSKYRPGDHRNLRKRTWRRFLRERSCELRQARDVARTERLVADHRCDEARRLLLDLRRSIDSELQRQGHRCAADDCGRCRVDVPARLRRGGLGRRSEDDRQVISTTDLPAFGSKHFEIPFDATGKKWVRFAAWDNATNGAMVMPIKLTEK